MNKKYPGLAFIWPTILMTVIFAFSACPAETSDVQSGFLVNIATAVFPGITDIGLITTIIRKAAHFTEYALLGFLFARAYSKNLAFARGDAKMILLSVVSAALYSTTDEVHQIFVPGRSCEFRDILVDTIGASVGALIYYFAFGRKQKTVQKQDKNSEKTASETTKK